MYVYHAKGWTCDTTLALASLDVSPNIEYTHQRVAYLLNVSFNPTQSFIEPAFLFCSPNTGVDGKPCSCV